MNRGGVEPWKRGKVGASRRWDVWAEVMKRLGRPSRLQELVRQWILLIPMATAVTGSLGVVAAPEDDWVDYLPPLFFVGALIVTTAMMHQRRMAQANMDLASRLQGANDRLDTLHRLALRLSESLDVMPVARTVLDSLPQALNADAAALWLRRDLLPISLLNPAFRAALPLPESPEPDRWTCLGAQGFNTSDPAAPLPVWDRILEEDLWSGQLLAQNLADDKRGLLQTPIALPPPAPASPLALDESGSLDLAEGAGELARAFGADDGAAVVPVTWEGEIVGALLFASWGRAINRGAVLLARDIALVAGPALQNSLSYSTATARAEIDALTNLYNHRVLQERLSQEMARASRALEHGVEIDPSRKLTVAIFDVTDFKLFNDTYGHGTGDKVLQYIAECLRNSFRAADIVARYGGDEFVVVLPETDCSAAGKVCRRAVDFVASKPFEALDGSRVAVRIACGLATFPENGTSISELFSHADERLYKAKRAGRLIIVECEGEEAPATPAGAPELAMRGPAPPDLWSGLSVFESLVAAVDSKDKYTRRHTEWGWKYTMRLVEDLNLSDEMKQAVHIAALVRDVGKIVVPDAILRKPGRLSDQEMAVMQQHTSFGEQLVKDVPHLELVLGGVRHHHERWDGMGYPDGLRGDHIPFVARILALPDSFVAMTIDRPYRRALSPAEAMREIEKGAGVQFDPLVVKAFARTLEGSAAQR
jgi:diguanylate cyclase (GGDEF)-like protein